MSSVSPTLEGFRAAFRRPLFTLAEITWRWVVGTTAIVLCFFGFFEFLHTLPVTSGELLFLRTRQPVLVSQAIAHILRGSLARGVLSLTLAIVLLTVIWMVAASLGRLAILEAMVEYFRNRFRDLSLVGLPHEVDARESSTQARAVVLLQLNFLRAAVVLAALVGLAGASIIAGFASPPTHPQPGLAFLLLVPMAGIVCVSCYALNWLLSLATVFVVRYAEDAICAISSAVAMCRERTGAVCAVGTWTGIAHMIALVGASTVVSVPLALTGLLPWRIVALGVFIVTLVYFAVADWLYTARFAGYVCIADMPEALPAPIQSVSAPPTIRPSEGIDRDELILSDVPLTSGV
ncbi:MAG TPA: hypothetical protein VMG82_26695 [Candidatus Sulfotelmatobacter sp.]|nr:hypothetical protein [Candidatus Sulfotelmatobacter sp.]